MSLAHDLRHPQPAYRCLGPVSLTSATGMQLGFRTRKQLALFTLFVRRPGQPLSRDRLIDLLWSEGDLCRARHSLSQSISLINKVLGCEAIVGSSKDELLLREGLVWADVTEFERCAAQRRQRDARTLWRGNLLEDVWIRRAPNFERWLEAERRRLLETMRRALHDLLGSSRTEGNWEEMHSVAESLLELDGLDETAMLAQLLALTLLGDRTLALRRYAAFEQRLHEELGAEPGPEMRDWARRQRTCARAQPRQRTGPGSAIRVSEPSPPLGARPLYGRTAEFAALWQAWDAARGGRGGCVLLLGPPGIGKSALAAKLADQVHVAGGAVCIAPCFRTEKCVPFAPVSALVRQMAELPGFIALSGVWISELCRLAPELRERFPNAPPALAADDSVRHRVCEATCRAGECVSFEQPLLMLVDNVQDADETTLALLHYFGRQANAQRTLLLCVARSEDEADREGGEFAEQARTQGFAQLQRVGPLEDEHLQRIVTDVLMQRGLEAPTPVVQIVSRLARGNPLHATELALAIPACEGRPTSDWLLGIADRSHSAVESFERSATARLAALSAGARAVMALLAVAARPLAEHEILAVTQLAPAELASAVFELEAARLLRREGARFGFMHDSYSAVAEAALTSQARVAIHARLAAVLAESAARNPAARIEVALHLERAGAPGEARAHALAAADFAGSVGAVSERAEALELVRRVSGPYDGDVAAALAACYLGLRQFDRVDALCEEARAQPLLEARLRGEFRYLQIAVDQHSGRAPLSRICGALEELLGPRGFGEFAHRADAMTLLMRTADKTGDFRLVRSTARAQRRAPPSSGAGKPSAHALFASAYVFAKYYWPQRALPLLEQARRMAEAEQNWELEHACRDGLGVVLKQLGRFPESIDQIRYSLALARRTLSPQAQAASLVNLAVSEMALGDFEVAATHLEESAQIDAQYPRWALRVYRYYNQGELALEMDKVDEASAAYRKALSRAQEMDLWHVAVICCGGLALCGMLTDNCAELASWCEQLRTVAMGREHSLCDRWPVEAAFAWEGCINDHAANAIDRLNAATRELSRRDVDQWLRLSLESIRICEGLGGAVELDRRRSLAALARRYSAAAIVSKAEAKLDSSPSRSCPV
jgi:DNA-binding SARP family transcriptional activator/tetratricopeptide (TPR) repeat protein